MSLIVRIKEDMKKAMRNKDTAKLSTLRMLLAKLENKKVEKKLPSVNHLSEDEVVNVIRKNVKELDKEIASYEAVGRTTEKQEAEKEVLQSYLPREASHEEVEEALKDILKSAKDGAFNIGMGLKAIAQKLGLPFDKAHASKLLKEEMKKMDEYIKRKKSDE